MGKLPVMTAITLLLLLLSAVSLGVIVATLRP
jgi:hypothetical protein